jgi:hypothetical protein
MTYSDYTGPLGTHAECWNLLPWIANESAAARDVARVEDHLRDCKECREELEFQRQLRNAIRSQEAVVLAPQTSLQKLMQRIDNVDTEVESEQVAASSPAAAAVVAAPRREMPRWVAVAAAVQGIAITGLLATLWSQSRESLTAPRFTTLTTATAVAHGPVIRVVFAADTALADVNQVLRSIDAQIVAGPSEAGVYTLGLSAEDAAGANVEQAMARLRADSRIMFAERAVASEAP